MPHARTIYLDWNSTTPVAEDVLAAMVAAQSDAWGNPASVHVLGRRARAIVESCREAVASTLGVSPRDVYLTSGGTEANNLALWSSSALVTSRLEHPSVTGVAEMLEQRGVPVGWLQRLSTGAVDPEEVDTLLAGMPSGGTLAVAAVNHETGVIQPIRALLDIAQRHGARLHVDAVQALGKQPHCEFEQAHSVAGSAHKLRGPKGIGFLAWRGAPPAPVLRGGAQERGVRPGTQDAVLAAGFRAALDRLPAASRRLSALQGLRDALESSLAGRVTVNGGASSRVAHVSNVAFDGWRGDELVAALDLEGICVSSGSACSVGSSSPSAVVSAMHDPSRARQSVRFSLGETTSRADVDRAIERVLTCLGRPAPHFK